MFVISSSEESTTAANGGGDVWGVSVEPGSSLQRSLKSEEGVSGRLDSDDGRVSVSNL